MLVVVGGAAEAQVGVTVCGWASFSFKVSLLRHLSFESQEEMSRFTTGSEQGEKVLPPPTHLPTYVETFM